MYTFYYAGVENGKICSLHQSGTPLSTDGMKLPLTMTEFMLLRAKNANEIEALKLIFDVKKVAARIQKKLDRLNNEES